VSPGILFDINSDRVKPESYGSLKEIANVLTENKDVKIQATGNWQPPTGFCVQRSRFNVLRVATAAL